MAHIIDCVLTLKDRFSSQLQHVSSSLSAFERRTAYASSSIKRTSKAFTSAGSAMVTGLTLPLTAVGVASGKAAVDFESAFAGVKKTVNASTEQFAKLRQGILDMSKTMPQSASEIANVAESAGQLGIQTDKILGFTKTMVMLGDSTNLSADQAATSLARFANITQMSQDKFSNLGSVLVALGNNLATTESEITEMGLRLAGAGKQVGLSQAQIMGFAGALSSVGIEAEAGGSAFSKVFIDMQLAVQKGGKSLNNFAKVAGTSGKQFQQAFKKDAAGAMISFIKGLSEAKKHGTTAIKMLDDMGITEVRTRDALLRAAGAGDLFNKSLQIGTEAWQKNNALQNEANQRYATTASKLKMLKNKLVDLGIQIGGILLPYIQRFADKLGNLIESFSKLDKGTQKNILKFGLMAASIGPVIWLIGKLTGTVFLTLDRFRRLSRSIRKAGGLMAWLTSPGAKVVMIITAILVVTAFLITHWDSVKKKAYEVGQAFLFVKNKAISFKNALVNLAKNGVQKAINIFNKFTAALKKHKVAIRNTAIVLGVIFGPALIKVGTQAAIAGSKIALNFIKNIILVGKQAVIAGIKLTVNFVRSLIKVGIQSTIAGAKLMAGLVKSIIICGINAAKTAAIIAGRLVISIIQFALQGWRSVACIAAQTAAWLVQKGIVIAHTVGLIACKAAMLVLNGATTVCTVAQWALNAAFLATPIGWICVGIAAIVAAVIGLYQAWCHNWGGMQDKVKSVVEKIKGIWNGLKSFLAHPITGIINLVKTGSVSGKEDGSHATGLTRVPYNGYRAVLHEDEMVLTKHQAENYRHGMIDGKSIGSGINITIQNMNVRQESDINSIANALANKIHLEMLNMA